MPIALPVVGLVIVALLGALALINFMRVDPGRRSEPAHPGTWGPALAARVCTPRPASSAPRIAHIPAREIVLEEFARRKRLECGAWGVRQGWVEVPDLVAAICCPRDRVVRSPTQARAALAELYQDGLVELELVSEREALGSGDWIALFLPGPRGRYFGWARLVRPQRFSSL